MIRVLIIIAVVGFFVSIVTLGGASALVGPDVMKNGWDRDWGWNLGHRTTRIDPDGDFDIEIGDSYKGPTTTREIAWDGSQTLDLDIPAEIRFTQAEGPGKLVITGPARVVERLRLDDGRLHDGYHRNGGRLLTIVMTAPNVTRFDLSGADKLTIENFKQESLEIDASGFAQIVARGETGSVNLELSGAGEADLGGLKARDADIELSGAGKATISPTGRATIDISGVGQVTLLTEPAEVESDISGAGRIIHAAPRAAAAPKPEPKTTT